MIVTRQLIRIIIKVMQCLTSLFAASFTMFYNSHYKCDKFDFDIDYPFNFRKLSIDWSNCNPLNYTIDFDLINNTQFYVHLFVITSWMSFSYTLIVICLLIVSALKVKVKLLKYIFIIEIFIVFADLSVSVIVFIFWFFSQHLWGNYFISLKKSLKYENLIEIILICKNENMNCIIKSNEKLNLLNFALLCGFLNVILWAGDIVFLLDELFDALTNKYKIFKNKIEPSIVNDRKH